MRKYSIIVADSRTFLQYTKQVFSFYFVKAQFVTVLTLLAVDLTDVGQITQSKSPKHTT